MIGTGSGNMPPGLVMTPASVSTQAIPSSEAFWASIGPLTTSPTA